MLFIGHVEFMRGNDKMANSYVLNDDSFRRLLSLKASLICDRCKQPLTANEIIVSKGKIRKHYHRRCYEAMYL